MRPILACVYRSGGDYRPDHVAALHYSARKWHQKDFEFRCYSDVPWEIEYPGVTAVQLINNWPGWWSVTEIFRTVGPTVVVGLDTVFVAPIDSLFQIADSSAPDDFWMIRNLGKGRGPASGIMIWNGDWSWIYEQFDFNKISRRLRGDENWTLEALSSRGLAPKILQDSVDGIYSFKIDVRGKLSMPADAMVIVFHGIPRPHGITSKWRVENYPLTGEGPRKNG